jgi:hypothetical protein
MGNSRRDQKQNTKTTLQYESCSFKGVAQYFQFQHDQSDKINQLIIAWNYRKKTRTPTESVSPNDAHASNTYDTQAPDVQDPDLVLGNQRQSDLLAIRCDAVEHEVHWRL